MGWGGGPCAFQWHNSGALASLPILSNSFLVIVATKAAFAAGISSYVVGDTALDVF
jgi:hypothetical protein